MEAAVGREEVRSTATIDGAERIVCVFCAHAILRLVLRSSATRGGRSQAPSQSQAPSIGLLANWYQKMHSAQLSCLVLSCLADGILPNE